MILIFLMEKLLLKTFRAKTVFTKCIEENYSEGNKGWLSIEPTVGRG